MSYINQIVVELNQTALESCRQPPATTVNTSSNSKQENIERKKKKKAEKVSETIEPNTWIEAWYGLEPMLNSK